MQTYKYKSKKNRTLLSLTLTNLLCKFNISPFQISNLNSLLCDCVNGQSKNKQDDKSNQHIVTSLTTIKYLHYPYPPSLKKSKDKPFIPYSMS